MVCNQKDTRQVRREISYDYHFAFKLPTVSSSSLFCSQSSNVTGTSYSLSQVSQNKPYVFQVRSTVAEFCGDSDLWSDWSNSVEWGTGEILLSHSEGHGWICSHLSSYSFFPIMFLCYVGNSRQGGWQGFYGVLSVLLPVLLLFLLGLMLCYCER